MILSDRWLTMILDGQKTVEIRGRPAKPGIVWFGKHQMLHGSAYITHAEKLSITSFRKMQHKHGMNTHILPYPQTHALHMTDIKRLRSPQPYFHPRGAIGWVRYRNKHQAGAPEAQPNNSSSVRRKKRNKQATSKRSQTHTKNHSPSRSQNDSERQDKTMPDMKHKKPRSRCKAPSNKGHLTCTATPPPLHPRKATPSFPKAKPSEPPPQPHHFQQSCQSHSQHCSST